MLRKTLSNATLLALACVAAQSNAFSKTITVGTGKDFPSPAQINWATVAAGDSVVIYPGTYTQMGTGNSMTISNVHGTPSQRITVSASSTANRPILSDGINISQSDYVTVSGLEVTRNPAVQPWAAVVVQGGAADITLSNLKVRDADVGVNFSQNGLRDRIEGSEVYNSKNHGITAGVPADYGDANNLSYISGNNVHDNGAHGIDIESSYWRIQGNVVTNNGSAYGGTSGIHLFSSTDSATLDCDYNQVYYNYVTGQKDNAQGDGNGIQIDHFCDSNTVAFNVVWANAGAGVSLLVGKNNTIVANTSYRNATDQHRLVFAGVIRAEIILESNTTVCTNNGTDGTCLGTIPVPAQRTGGNVVYDNVVVSSQANVPGIFANSDYVNPARQTNYLYPNLYYNSAGGGNLTWGSTSYYNAVDIDNITGLTAAGGGNLTVAPTFVNSLAPGQGSDGLRLSTKPSKEGWTISPTVVDMLGTLPIATSSYFGAYYKN